MGRTFIIRPLRRWVITADTPGFDELRRIGDRALVNTTPAPASPAPATAPCVAHARTPPPRHLSKTSLTPSPSPGCRFIPCSPSSRSPPHSSRPTTRTRPRCGARRRRRRPAWCGAATPPPNPPTSSSPTSSCP
eukprot:scaffold42066_cov67-Phaeocystis_antarctica.AAC.4